MSKYKDLVDYLKKDPVIKSYDEDNVEDLKNRILELENKIDRAKNQMEKYLEESIVEEIFEGANL